LLVPELRCDFDGPYDVSVELVEVLSGNPILSMSFAADSLLLVTIQK
jgi:hypothetical protein